MKKIIIATVFTLNILFASIFLIIKNNERKNITLAYWPSQSVIEFTATINIASEQVNQANKNDWYISFDKVQATDKEKQIELSTFNKGGSLITSLPVNKKIKSGDKINVVIHRDFSVTHSIPPQLIGNSVISISFN